MHELNQVAGVTSQSIVFLKRKVVSSAGWELVKYPLSDCVEIHYAQDVPLTQIIGGVLLIAGIYGVKMALGGRRHRLKFKMHDGGTLTWKSRAGERQLMGDSVNAIVEFARSKGLLAS